jgi:hypothetical protein
MNRHHRIKQVGEIDTVGFQPKLEISTNRIERPRSASLSKLQAHLIRAKQHLFTKTALAVFEVHGDGIVTDRLNRHDAHDLV